ncbi:type II toxin-antitoxin system PemK/MazF family toxin [Oceanobacillus sp. CAU 1775]
MKVGHLYELYFKYEEGQGGKKRPVLILVINNEHDIAIGLKITSTGPTENHPNRIKIEDSPNANLSPSSHVQYDIYDNYEIVKLKSRGYLSQHDFARVARMFKKYHNV